ncbi:MAG: T9SS type A sorting domain-containing protein [Bacteroidota bacterium]
MKRVIIICLMLVVGLINPGKAQVNFSEHIAPIIYENCTSCHRQGEVGPMSLASYEEVSSWAPMIEYVTAIKYMPPFPPDVNYSHFLYEKSLTDEQIQMIGDWVDAGTPQGNPDLEPPLPVFPTGSQIGTPDLVLTMEEAHTVVGNNQDDYRVFVLPTGFTEDKEIAAIEFRPGNNRAVHHALIAYDVSGEAAAKDAATPEYGYYSFGDFGVDAAAYSTWGYVPGTSPLVYPEGIGEIIPAGADLLIQVHYAPLPTDETDQSSVNIFFKKTDDPITREVRQASVTPFNLPGGFPDFVIPANEEKTFVAESLYEDDSWTPGIDYDISLISIEPHSHYLGKSYEIFAVTPQNDTINIINIPEWDFNWQGSYTFHNMKKIPANSTWHTISSYDNTDSNPANPTNPPIDVTWGEGTEDEMLLVGVYFIPYEEGDEDIDMNVLDMITSNQTAASSPNNLLHPPIPNPAKNSLTVSFTLEQREQLQLNLIDMLGRKVMVISASKIWTEGDHAIPVNVSKIKSGQYLIELKGEDYTVTQKIIISN